MTTKFDDLPGAAEYLARRQEMLARHDRERYDLADRQMAEARQMTEAFIATIQADQPSS